MIDPDVREKKETLEYGSYVKIVNDTRYPAVSSTSGSFNHYAILTQDINPLPGLGASMHLNDNQKMIQKYGFNYDVDNVTSAYKHGIWTVGGEYPYNTLSVARELYVESTDINDNGVLVEVQGLDSNWEEITVQVTLQNRTTIPNTWHRVYRAQIKGSVESNGDIQIGIKDTGELVAEILAEEQQTLMAIYTVPRGYTGYLMNFESSISRNEDVLLRLRIREHGEVFKTKHLAHVYESTYRYDYDVYKQVSEMSDIELTVTPVNNNVAVHGAFDLILIKN